MKGDSLKKYYLSRLYNWIKTVLPLITMPIISRAFGPSGVGVISFSFNIVQCFLMIASVGVQLYFNRVIPRALTTNSSVTAVWGYLCQ